MASNKGYSLFNDIIEISLIVEKGFQVIANSKNNVFLISKDRIEFEIPLFAK